MKNWNRPMDRSAHALPRREVLLAADRHGCTIISAPKLARLSGVSTKTCWTWLRGGLVSDASDRAIRDALGLGVRRAA